MSTTNSVHGRKIARSSAATKKKTGSRISLKKAPPIEKSPPWTQEESAYLINLRGCEEWAKKISKKTGNAGGSEFHVG